MNGEKTTKKVTSGNQRLGHGIAGFLGSRSSHIMPVMQLVNSHQEQHLVSGHAILDS